jgi:hypothetical protein
MKKLLIFMLVLGLASVANAGLVDVVIDTGRGGHVDNNGNGVIDASDDIHIKITTSLMLAAFDLDLNVLGTGTLGEYWDLDFFGAPCFGPGPTGLPGCHANDGMGGAMWVYSGIIGNSIPTMADATFGPGMTGDLVWALTIHCTGEGPVNVNLTTAPGGTYDVMGYVVTPADLNHLVITQVPEPMTIMLLGLGGLLLRRRK